MKRFVCALTFLDAAQAIDDAITRENARPARVEMNHETWKAIVNTIPVGLIMVEPGPELNDVHWLSWGLPVITDDSLGPGLMIIRNERGQSVGEVAKMKIVEDGGLQLRQTSV